MKRRAGFPPKGQRRRRERGATLVLFGMLQLALLTISALVVDIGYVRAAARRNQSIVDLAVLAAGNKLSEGDYLAACTNLITTLNANTSQMPAINANAFCTQGGNDVTKTVCSLPGVGLGQAKPKVTAGAYTVEVHFPVPLSEIWNSKYGDGLNDGQPCQRMRLLLTTKEPVFFGGVAGSNGHKVTRTATLRSKSDPRERVPALWLLDPHGCTPLAASGGSRVTVGVVGDTITPGVPGIIKLDSDGSTCSSNQVTISSTGASTLIQAIPTTATANTPKGFISLYGLPPGATTCVAPICDPADVAGGRLVPQPQGSTERATRAPADWRYNCKSSYPSYHGLAIESCSEGKPPYLDLLRSAITPLNNPMLFQKWTTSHSCNPSGNVSVSGNWWIDCNGGLSIGNGTTLTFEGGNIVMDKGLTMTGGVFNVNTVSDPTRVMDSSCIAPTAFNTTCLGTGSDNAAFIYMRDGSWDITGGTLNLNHVSLIQQNGYVKVSSATPNWTSPTEGPFKQLSLWSEKSSNKFQINGGAGISLEGIFFTPEADPLSLSGGGDWGQLSAQFISYRVAVSGGGTLTMAPNESMLSLPPTNNMLIR